MLRKISLVLITLFVFNFCKSTPQTNNSNQVKEIKKSGAVVELLPPEFRLPFPEGRFIQKELFVHNKGTDTLIIKAVKGSCYCASSTVLNSIIAPDSTGKILINVNVKGLFEENNVVGYTIESNAQNSPTELLLTVLPKSTDSTNQKK
jgi:hypothetical protein